jgi:hypothetical protein
MDVVSVTGTVVGAILIFLGTFAIKHPEVYGRLKLIFIFIPCAVGSSALFWWQGWVDAHASLGKKAPEGVHPILAIGLIFFGAAFVALALYGITVAIEVHSIRKEIERIRSGR